MYYDLSEQERVELEETLGNGLCPPIPREVWEDRVARCRALMKERRLDAILVYSGGQDLTGHQWARYFVNYKEPLWNGESFILVPVEGELCFITNYTHMVPLVRQCSPVEDVRAYEYFNEANRYSAMVPQLRDAIEGRGLAGGRIGLCRCGMQGDFLPALLEHTFAEALKKEEVVDASGLLWELIAEKTDYDVEMIRRANAIACDGLQAVYGVLGEGSKEHEHFAAFWKAVCDRGAELSLATACHVSTKMIRNRPFVATLRRFRRGDQAVIDFGITYRGYASDIARTVVIGKPSPAQKKIFEATLTGHRAMAEALRPGITVAGLCESYFRTIEKLGYRREQTHALQGHGIGFLENEPPILSNWQPDYVIKKGMTLDLETLLFSPNEGCAGVEDCYLVTNGEAERLTPGPQDMYVA